MDAEVIILSNLDIFDIDFLNSDIHSNISGYKEYYDGKLYIKPPLDDVHKIIINYLKRIFLDKYDCYAYSVELLLMNTEQNVTAVRPDLAIYDDPIINSDKITTEAPSIVFEIITAYPNGKEGVFKPVIYSNIGVLEYWIIDTISLSVEVSDYHNDVGFSYKFASGCMKSLVFDNLCLNFEDIYKELVQKKLITPKPIERQPGIYAPKGSNFDPWKIINS